MNCKQARRFFGAFWDDELTQAEREWLGGHFASCPACRSAYEELARTLELVGGLPRVEVNPGFAELALARARRAADDPDRVPASAARWIPITATAALLAVLGGMVFQWAGLPLMTARRELAVAAREAIPQPTLVEPVRVSGPRDVDGAHGGAPQLAGSVAQIPDSLFDHSEDVEFILDPVTLRKGRAHTVVRGPQDAPRGQQATITF